MRPRGAEQSRLSFPIGPLSVFSGRARAPPAVAGLEWQGAGGAPSEPGGGEGGKEERGVSEPDAPGGEGGGGSSAAASASAAWD